MRKMGLVAIYQRPRTSKPHPEHQIYPYLLRSLDIAAPNQVWRADITYISMHHGFMYLVARMDWASRKVLSWRLSNTMETDFCVAALEEAIDRYGRPEIFNTDQGSQFTADEFTKVLKAAGGKKAQEGTGMTTIRTWCVATSRVLLVGCGGRSVRMPSPAPWMKFRAFCLHEGHSILAPLLCMNSAKLSRRGIWHSIPSKSSGIGNAPYARQAATAACTCSEGVSALTWLR